MMMSTARRGMVYSHSVETFSPRTNSYSPRNQRYSSGSNGQRPSKDGGRTGSPQDRKMLSSPKGRSPRRSKTDLLHQGILQTSDIHQSLYDDAFARSQRLEMMRHQREEEQEQQLKEELEQKEERMKGWSRLYHYRDHRTHLEREEATLRRKYEKIAKLEAELKAKEEETYRECTFQPSLKKSLSSLHPGRTKAPPPIQTSSSSREVALSIDPEEKLRRLVERQHAATVQLQGLAQDEERLRQHLHTVHSELHERIQREETQRVVLMLQDADAEGSTQRDLIQRVRHMVQSGDDPEVAQRQIVEELVTRSQDEVRRRVQEAYGPIRLELEGDLYQRRLALVHELEALEAQAIALRGGTLVEDARQMGFEFGLAEKCRRSLSFMTPGSTQRVPTPPIMEDAVISSGLPVSTRQRITNFGESAQSQAAAYTGMLYARDAGKPAAQAAGRNLTPRSAATPQALSRQSSGGGRSSEAAIVHTAAMMVQQDVPVELCEREEMSADGRSPRERAAAAAAVAAALATSSSTSSMPGALPSASELKDSHYSCLTSTHMTLTSPARDDYNAVNGMQASGSGQGSTPQSPLSPRQNAAVATAVAKVAGGAQPAETPPMPVLPVASFAVPGGLVQDATTCRSVASGAGAAGIFQVQTIGALPMTPPQPSAVRSNITTVVPAATMESIRVRSGTATPTYTGAAGTASQESMRFYSGSQTPSVATPGAVTPPAPAIVSARTLPSRNAAQMFMQAQSIAPPMQEEVVLSSDKSQAVLSHRTVAPAPAQVMTCSNRVMSMSSAVPPALGMSTSAGNLRTIPSSTMPVPTIVSAGAQPVAPSRSVAALPQMPQGMACSGVSAAAGQYPSAVVDSYRHLTPIQRGRAV